MISYRLHLPAGVEEEIRGLWCAEAHHSPAVIERVLWVLSEIVKRGQIQWLDCHGYAITSYDHLERGCPRSLISRILRFLRDHGFIERDRYYLPAKSDPTGQGKSYGYRLTKKYRDSKIVRSEGQSQAVQATLQASFDRAEQHKQENPLPSPYRELDHLAKQIHLVPSHDDPSIDLDQMKPQDREALQVIEDLMEEQHRWGNRDEFGERLHETHQVVPRRFRNRVRIGDATTPPQALDIAASQPLILTWLLTQESETRSDRATQGAEAPGGAARGTGETGEAPEGRNHNECRYHSSLQKEGSGTRYPSDCQDFTSGLQREIAEIQDLCCHGDLYEALVGSLQSVTPFSEDDPHYHRVDRAEAKSAFMTFCMGSPLIIQRSRAGQAVRKRWPHLWKAVYNMARNNEPKYIARMLQRKEAEMVLCGAAARILEERPDIVFGTVHDSIICDEQHASYVQGCIEDAYLQGIGVVPRVRVEEYGKVG